VATQAVWPFISLQNASGESQPKISSKMLTNSFVLLLRRTQTRLEASRDIGLEINAEKTNYMIMSRYPNSGQSQNIRIAN
jgi:hypothetical protein